MTTRDVFDRHLSHQLDGDLDGILSDYAPDAIVVGPKGIGSGHDHIRKSYERVLPLISSLMASSIFTPSTPPPLARLSTTGRERRRPRDRLAGELSSA
jgi:hypothetical protein